MANSIGDTPVLYTEDPTVEESILRVAAVADIDVNVQPRVSTARGPWSTASLVMLGPDAVLDALHLGLARRPGVLIVRLDDADVWRAAVQIGAEAVVTLPGEDAVLIARLVDPDPIAGHSAPIIAVTGACGGAGASHLAVAIARSAALRLSRGALLIDGDPLGGGLELLVELENAPGLRWRDLAATRGRIPPDALRDALPRVDGLHVLSHDRQSTIIDTQAWEAILDAGTQGCDLTVVDSPREGCDIALGRSRLSILVVPADLRSIAAAAARIPLLHQESRDLRIVVRQRRESDLDSADVASALELPILGEYADAKPVSAERIAEMILASVGVTGRQDGASGRAQSRRSGRRAA